MILNACDGKNLPIYGDGANIRDWLHVEDHCSAIWEVLIRGRVGETYCIGGNSEKTNLEVVDTICGVLDELKPEHAPHQKLKTFVRTAQDMIVGTRSMRQKRNLSLVGNPEIILKVDLEKLLNGTWKMKLGGNLFETTDMLVVEWAPPVRNI